MSTASQLATRCDTRFKGGTNSVISVGEWLAYLNEAYDKVNRFSPNWPWLETSEQTLTVPDSGVVGAIANRSAALPADVLAVAYAYDVTDDYRLIDQQAAGDFYHQDHLRSEVGQPVTYRLRGSTLELNPTPLVATTVVIQAVLLPSALAADTVLTFEATGGVAGNIAATGVNVGDTLLAVGGVKTADQTYHDFTAEFSITGTNVINNSGGTNSTGYKLVVVWKSLSSVASPVWPSQYHDILIDGAMAQAYLDDGNPGQGDKYQTLFQAGITGMLTQLGQSRTETNSVIRDTFWS
jgi:hypothetical protein